MTLPSLLAISRWSKPVIDQPEWVLPVTVEATLEPTTEELKYRLIGTSAVTPGSVNSRSVNNALPVPTSTDTFAVPDTPESNRVALRRSPAAGAGFDAAEAGVAATVTPTNVPAVNASTPNTDDKRARRTTLTTGLALTQKKDNLNGRGGSGHCLPQPHHRRPGREPRLPSSHLPSTVESPRPSRHSTKDDQGILTEAANFAQRPNSDETAKRRTAQGGPFRR